MIDPNIEHDADDSDWLMDRIREACQGKRKDSNDEPEADESDDDIEPEEGDEEED